MIKLVAFDWNGTLLADAVICWKIDNDIFEVLNKPFLPFKGYQEIFDIPISKMFLAHGFTQEEIDENADYIVHAFHDAYEAWAVKARTRTGTRDILKWLKKQKITVIIFSNHSLDGLDRQMKRLGIGEYFDILIGNDGRGGSFNGRSKKDKLASYIKKKGFKAKEVLLVGDTVEEIQIGKEIKAKTAAIIGGYHSRKLLVKHKPDYIITNLLDLKKIVLKS
ncbi:MAG: HAD family hydrolase [Patescibacteria group bacterium]